MYFASGRLDAPGAMFTASHNPAQYNGIKLCLAGARPVGEDTGPGRDQGGGGVHRDRREPGAGARRATVTTGDVLDDYATNVRSFVD